MATKSKLKFEKFQYDIDIQRGPMLYGLSGKFLYTGQWITGKERRVIIVEMNREIAEREARFYRELNNHDHIIRTFGEIENTSNLTIYVQEYAKYGDLANMFMDNEIHFCSSMFLEIFSQITDGMIYIASKSIVHGDLACRNILVYQIKSLKSKNILVKITDFGLARFPSTVDNSSIIPIRYCAPEILQDNPQSNYSEKSDVYSMAVLMWEALSTGEIPYSSISSDDDVKQKKLKDEKLVPPSNCDREFCKIMGKSWSFKPTERINFVQMKEQLSEVIIVELSDTQISTVIHQLPIVCKYRLDIDVQMAKESLNGSFGKTYQAQWITKQEQDIVLIKLNQQPNEWECSLYNGMKSHPHIIDTFGFVENNLQSILVLQERAAYGNLQVLLEKDQFQPLTNVLIEIFRQIIDAMIYITKENFVHGDLRCANILVFKKNDTIVEENLVKLTNFTSAQRNDPSVSTERRSKLPIRYCAPEILRSAGRSNYSELSDVYSMGVLMWEACSNGQIPYHTCQLNSEVQQRKLNGEKLSKPWLCNEKIWEIIKSCWYNEPTLRYNFEEIKSFLSPHNLKDDQIFQYEKDVHIKIDEKLHGKFGKVFHAAEWIPNRIPSILVIIMNEKTASQEVPYYLKFKSEESHIICSFGLIRNNPRVTILVQECAPHGNLQVLLQKKQYEPKENVLVHIFLQIIDAMIYMANKHIVHGNLCCKNILVFQMNSSKPKENLVKITNFSQACKDDSSNRNNRETIIPIRYCAPEILGGGKYSALSDIYSMGVLMWEAYSTGTIPYAAIADDNDVRQCIINGEKLIRPQMCNNQIWSIIHDCWFAQPEVRFNFPEMHTRLGHVCVTCQDCKIEYLKDEIALHQRSCSSESQVTPIILPEKKITKPTQPTNRKSIFQRIRSFFGGKE